MPEIRAGVSASARAHPAIPCCRRCVCFVVCVVLMGWGGGSVYLLVNSLVAESFSRLQLRMLKGRSATNRMSPVRPTNMEVPSPPVEVSFKFRRGVPFQIGRRIYQVTLGELVAWIGGLGI